MKIIKITASLHSTVRKAFGNEGEYKALLYKCYVGVQETVVDLKLVEICKYIAHLSNYLCLGHTGECKPCTLKSWVDMYIKKDACKFTYNKKPLLTNNPCLNKETVRLGLITHLQRRRALLSSLQRYARCSHFLY